MIYPKGRSVMHAKFWKYSCLIMAAIIALRLGTIWLSRSGIEERAEVPEGLLPPPTPNLLSIRKNGIAIRPLHESMGKPQPGDWLLKYSELGQSFDQYLVDHRHPFHEKFSALYVQPLGETTGARRELLEDAADFLERFFGYPVRLLDPLSLDELPESARRPGASSSEADEQMLTTYLLESILKPRVPDDAVAVLGLSTRDLWAGEGWNYVFGQASLSNRIGVWSVHRFGDPEAGEEEYQVCLRRTLGTAAHETGHMLGIQHCIAYECGMNGSNNLAEKDRRPIEFCPECQQKIWWASGVDPPVRYRKLAEFAETHGLDAEAREWRQAFTRVAAETGVGN